MKTFLYTYSVGKPARNGSGTPKTCSVYAVVKNKPVFLTARTDAFVDEFQLVMDALEVLKANEPSAPNLPARAFKLRPGVGNGRCYPSAALLFKEGIADFHRID